MAPLLNEEFDQNLTKLKKGHNKVLSKKKLKRGKGYNGIYQRYKCPVLTAAYTPLHWVF